MRKEKIAIFASFAITVFLFVWFFVLLPTYPLLLRHWMSMALFLNVVCGVLYFMPEILRWWFRRRDLRRAQTTQSAQASAAIPAEAMKTLTIMFHPVLLLFSCRVTVELIEGRALSSMWMVCLVLPSFRCFMLMELYEDLQLLWAGKARV